VTAGSTALVSASGSIWTNSRRVASATTTRSTRSSTAGTPVRLSAERSRCSTASSTGAAHASTCDNSEPLRPETAPAQEIERRALASPSSRDRDTFVRPHGVQGPLRALDPEATPKRARPALRGNRPQHRQLRCGRVLERFPEIVSRLTAMLERFTVILDCVDVTYLPGEILDELPRRLASVRRASAASTSTRSVRASCSPASSRSRPHRKASPSLSSLRRCTR